MLEALTPTMFTTTALLSALIEVFPHVHTLHKSPYFETPAHLMTSLLLMAGLGLVAFVMIWVEF